MSKKKIFRFLSSFLSLILLLTVINLPAISAKAEGAAGQVNKVNPTYIANGCTRDLAVKWARARAAEHWEINDGSGWTQCVEFLWAYYDFLLGSTYWDIRTFNANQYLYNAAACPSGWTRPNKSTAKPGDIVIWDSYAGGVAGGVGHIGIITAVNGDTITTAEANAGYARGAASTYTRSLSGASGIIRPNFIGDASPQICLDSAGAEGPGKISVSGWAFDADNMSTAIEVQVYVKVGGITYKIGSTKANTYRPDVNDYYNCGNYHGFSGTFDCPYTGNIIINTLAINIGGGENTWAFEKQAFVTAPAPQPVKLSKTTITELTNSSQRTMTVRYKAVKNKEGYSIEYSTNSKFKKNSTRVTTGSTVKKIGKLTKGNIYYVRVRAYARDTSGKLVYSPWSTVQKVKIKK